MIEETYPETISELIVSAAEKAAPLFAHHGWSYYDGVPDKSRIIRTLEKLFRGVDRSDQHEASVSTGRFTVRKYPSDTDEPGFTYQISLDLGEVDV